MGHAYKLLFIFRPIVWFLVAAMVAAFGRRFLKGLLNVISIFLFIISIGGCYLIDQTIRKMMDPFYLATTDDWTKCIIGSVTIVCFLVCAVAYMLFAKAVDGKEEEVGKFTFFLQKATSLMIAFMLPFAIMGYCLPFFLLDSIAGVIVGIIGECVGLFVAVKVGKKFFKKDTQQ